MGQRRGPPMFRKLIWIAAIGSILAGFPARAQQGSSHEHGDAGILGTVVFPITCNASARAHFTRAVSWLHSFEYEDAERSFVEATTADAACAMGYWGIAMSQYHPLWAPPTVTELEKGRRALARAQQAPTQSARERDYIAALSAFYDSNLQDHRSRTFAYERAMEALSAQNPTDREASIFHALSLIAAGMIDDDTTFKREKKAAAILNEALAEAPNHPGIAHYVIHSYDFPALAPLALPAARRYADIAPASAHAQHMPSHIFTRLGLWEEAIRADMRAEAAARAYAQRNRLAGSWDERLHAMDYLAYAYLQSAQDSKAEEVQAELDRIEHVDPANFKVAHAFAAIPVRLILERKRWDEAAAISLSANAQRVVPWDQFRWAEAHIHFARAIGGARTKNLALARSEIASLAAIRDQLAGSPGNYDWGRQVEIQRQVAAAWLEAAEGRRASAVALMRKAADLDDATEKHPVTPGQILPAREQLAELLLTFRQPNQALPEFERVLTREPGRFNAIYGAARSARELGKTAHARRRYSELVAQSCLGNGRRAELDEANSFLGPVRASLCATPTGSHDH